MKLRPDGTEATRYPGEAMPSPPGWLVARARWEHSRLDLGYLVFEPGAIFHEFFALDRPFNAFAVFDTRGVLTGWYCNVTYPTRIVDGTVYWHDLYVDVIAYPDGRSLVLDEDELDASGLADRDTVLVDTILDARDTLLRMVRERAYPFSEGSGL